MKTTYKWGPEEKKYLSEICKGRSYKEIIELMSQKFSYEFSKGQIEGTMQNSTFDTKSDIYIETNGKIYEATPGDNDRFYAYVPNVENTERVSVFTK